MTHVDDNTLFLDGTTQLDSDKSKGYFYNRWWHQGYTHQRAICRLFEAHWFHALTIVLVIVDCVLVVGVVMLEFIKLKAQCIENSHKMKIHRIIHQHEHDIETAMKVCDYASIAILTFFMFELLVKMIVFGRAFWNIYRKKMEYFDAIIVIVSFAFDIYFLLNEEREDMFSNRAILIISLRLWRIIRIINTQFVRDEEQSSKHRLSQQYLAVVQQLIDLLKYKTDYIEEQNEDASLHFHQMDSQCQAYLDLFNKTDRQFTSFYAVKQFAEQMKTLDYSMRNRSTQE
ncbi:unnamed protein product [Didymodactylos carnosus]|uniref:Voltage-gated hydrogen channel 1 n=2 Tax=Didymodactylos carnosus TaxID=1234261 RepID=A0A8S2DRU6_9BILA|nr:unnamed protein product [Didymodactylos carnosus]CAF3807083.1 unnamed protein product [Didymodactylos carnosus]